MTTLFSLLSLPRTSNALTDLKTVTPSLDDGSASPPRKVARLTEGSDSASASRSRATKTSEGAIQIQIIGEYKSKPVSGERQLALLRRSIKTILMREPGPHDVIPATYENIYNACRSVINDHGEELYSILKTELNQSITILARSLSTSSEQDTAWITAFNSAFKWLDNQIGLLQSLLTYLDQSYAIHNRDVLSIRDLAYSTVNEQIFGSALLLDRLRHNVREWLVWERANNRPHRQREVIPTLIDHLLRHHQYSAFEEFYVQTTRSFYLEESKSKAEALKEDPKAFFDLARSRIEQEIDRSKAVLPVVSWGVVRDVTEQSLWTGRLEWLAKTTVSVYMESQDFDSLGAMYRLFSRVNGIKALCNAFADFVQITVSKIVKDVENDDEMVQRLLDFKDLADRTVNSSFLAEKTEVASTTSTSTSTAPNVPTASASDLPAKQPDQQFLYALTDAFATGFKSRRSKPAEMIAKYVDKAMRKGQGKATDAEFQDLLNKVLALYRFTDDKDVFRTFYHRSLAKRLLLEKSASDDFEKGMLKKLKENYDPEFGMGEDMFKDLALSRESMREYHSKLPEDSPGQKLGVMVLQRSAWPFSLQKHTVDLPPQMQAELTKYGEFYKSKHSGHVLEWDHSLGSVILKARFDAGVKELSVSMYQALVLLLFNEADEIPYLDIKAQTNMNEGELKRTLQSLACGKKKVLKKVPPGKDVDDTDVFHFNADFRDPHPKIHINSIQAKVSPEESKKTNASIEDDRKIYLDAAIVRIMKARKEMTYEQLKAATIEAVKSHFVPQVDSIKRRIDTLVETEYLERSPTDKNKYLYVA